MRKTRTNGKEKDEERDEGRMSPPYCQEKGTDK
jgi:hypothetical protein